MGDAELRAPTSERHGATLRGKGLALVVAAVVIAGDLWSKSAVFAHLEPMQNLWLLGGEGMGFGFHEVMNKGTMWGKFQNLSDYLPWVRMVAALVVLAMLLTTPAHARVMLAALGLVFGGALGNIYDGFRFQGVRDFLMVDLGWPGFDPFPIFNVADSSICVGVAFLALSMWFQPQEESPGAAAERPRA